MTFRWDYREHISLGAFVLKWFVICVPSSAVVGSAVALFLWSLDRMTEIQWQHPWLLYLLPMAGMVSGYLYHRFGQNAEAGNRDYLGLGVNANPKTPEAVAIQSCFLIGGVTLLSWWWKLLFIAITVGSGFKGGEVTPLFFIGAALGKFLGAPVDLMAALGFVAVFAGATNTPLACTIMAIELFAHENGTLMSSGFAVYAAIACFLSWFLSGNSSIYQAQRMRE